MRTITVELFDDGLRLSNDTLGRAGEKNIVQFVINFDGLRYAGLTTATLLYKPRNSPVLAMPSVEIPEGDLVTLVPDWAMAVFGITQVQLQLTGEGVETRSYIWDMRVERSLINYGDKPTPVQDWLQEVRDVIDDAASLTGFKVIDYFDTYDELIAAIHDPVPGAAYGVGTAAPYDVYVYGETSGWTNVGPIAVGGGGGESIVYVPSISKDGVLTWENNGDLPNPAPINIKGPKGDNGGAIFIPSVSDDGVLSWTNTGGLNNPPDVNLMGKDGTAPKITVRSVSTGYELVIDHPDGLREVVPIKNGSAPSVVVEEIDGGHRITIYGGNGPKSFDVMDGKDGTGGDVTAESITAALGYTPASKDDVSNVNECVYELIETITLEEAAVVDRTTEPDGTPYKFKAVLAFIETSGALAATNLYYYSGSIAVTLSPIVKKDTTTLSRIVLECVQQYGYWIGRWRSSWTTSGTTGTNESYITRINTHSATTSVKDHPYITRCRTSGELPTGTIVYIWGVRADG